MISDPCNGRGSRSEVARPDRERTDSYADGSPRARHTYDYIEFVPSVNRLMSFGGAALYPMAIPPRAGSPSSIKDHEAGLRVDAQTCRPVAI